MRFTFRFLPIFSLAFIFVTAPDKAYTADQLASDQFINVYIDDSYNPHCDSTQNPINAPQVTYTSFPDTQPTSPNENKDHATRNASLETIDDDVSNVLKDFIKTNQAEETTSKSSCCCPWLSCLCFK